MALDLKSFAIGKANGGGSGLTDAVKTALLNCFAHVAWIDENGQSYYNALETALNGGTPTIQYSVINNLTNATTDNKTSLIEAGKSYIAHISADSGYHIDTISCTMGGEIVDVTDNTISIESVTGNIVITAVAVEDSDLPFVSGEPYSIVWHADKTLNSTTGEENDYASFSVSDFIPVKGANRIEGVFYGKQIYTYDENKNYIGKVESNKGSSNGDIVYHSIYGDICYIKVENRTSLISTTYVTPYVDPVLTETIVPQNDTFYSLPNIEVGSISSSQGGQDVEGSNYIRCGYANCLSATTLKNIAGLRAFVFFYDAEKNYISNEINNNETRTVTVPENAQYFRITEDITNGYPTFVKVVK